MRGVPPTPPPKICRLRSPPTSSPGDRVRVSVVVVDWWWYWYRYVKEQRSVSHRRRMVASMQEKLASAPLGACVVAGAPAGQSKRRKGIGRCPEWPSQILTSPAAPCLSCTVGLQTSDDRHTARAGRFGSTPSPPSLSMGGERWRASCRSYVRVLGCY